MKLHDAMRKSATQFLEPGENLQEVFGAQTRSPWWILLGGMILMMIINDYRIVAVTDQRILILDAGNMRMNKAREVVDVLPRKTQLGPCHGTWHVIETPSGKIRVHRRFHPDVEASDEAIDNAQENESAQDS